jgi:cytochrome c oxidase subunit 3
MLLFIVSEIFFFLSFFWAFFHGSLSPNIELGGVWPPPGILTFNPFQVPLLNTVVLVSSGVRVTWAHHAIIEGQFSQFARALSLTVFLGLYFTFLQGLEYYEASFAFSDGVYGSTFFISTGFHGLHVLVGTLFLLTCLVRHWQFEFSPAHHFGFEAAAWYWHFVDVVWLFLYMVVYWWGGA